MPELSERLPEKISRRRAFHIGAGFLPGLAALPSGFEFPRNPLEHISSEALKIISMVEEFNLDRESGRISGVTNRQPLRQELCARIVSDIETGESRIIQPEIIILHWDGAPRGRRTATNTVNGLNDLSSGQAKSVQFCVDDTRRGILQTMPIPFDDDEPRAYKGIHLMANTQNPRIGQTLEGYADILDDPTYTDLFGSLDGLHRGRGRELNLFSVGIESVGERFAFNSLPPDRQTANMVSTVIFLMRTYQIPLWLILGHHEVQEGKSDVGHEYASYIKYLIAYYASIKRDEELLNLVLPNHRERTSKKLVEEFKASPIATHTQSILGDAGMRTLSNLLDAH